MNSKSEPVNRSAGSNDDLDRGVLEELSRVGVVTTCGPYLVRRIKDPAQALDEGTKRQLHQAFVSAATKMVGPDIAEYWEERPNYLQDLTEWWVVTHDNAIVGWCGLKVLELAPEPLIYVDTLGFLPEHQRGGLATLLAVEPWIQLSGERHRSLTMTFRTQSPAVLRVAASIAGPDTYPHPTLPNGKQGARATSAAQLTARHLGAEHPFDDSCFVSRGAFSEMGASLYGAAFPWSGDPALDGFFRRFVDHDAGDAVIGVMLGTPALKRRSSVMRDQIMRRLRSLAR